MAPAISPAGQVRPPTGGKSIQNLTAAGLYVEGEDGSQSDSDSGADELLDVLERYQDNGALTKVYRKHPMILANALKSLDDDDDILYKFLDKHRHIVGKFLNQHKKIDVLAEFLAKYPAGTQYILDEERSILENFLDNNPKALHTYLNAKPNVLRDYLVDCPEKFHTYISRSPSLLSEFCDKHPAFMNTWWKNRQATVHEHLLTNPALFWNHIAAHPACIAIGQTPDGDKFTATLVHDIPKEQQHLVKSLLSNDRKARDKALASVGEYEDNEISSAWENEAIVVEVKELERLAQQDDDWLNDNPHSRHPESLKWLIDGKLAVRAEKKERIVGGGASHNASASVLSNVQPSRRKLMNTRGHKCHNTLNTERKQPRNELCTDVDTKTPPPIADLHGFSEEADNIVPSIEISDNEFQPPRGSIKTIPGGRTVYSGKNRVANMAGQKITRMNNVRSTRGRACKDNNLKKINYDISSDDDDDHNFCSNERIPNQTAIARAIRSIKPISQRGAGNTQSKNQGKQNVAKNQVYNNSTEDDGEEFYVKEEEEDTLDDDNSLDISSDDDDYDSGKGSQKRKKIGRTTRRQTNNNAATTSSSSSGSSAPTPITDRLRIPYPAPSAALAADALKSRSVREWSLQEEDCGIRHMLDVRDEGKLRGEHRFQAAANRMNAELGTNRTKISFKNFWNRCGRMRSGFDERRRQQAPLATSLQGRNVAPPTTPPRSAPTGNKALRKETDTKTKVAATSTPSTTDQAESSNDGEDDSAVIEFDKDSDAEEQDAHVARVLRELSHQDDLTRSASDVEDDVVKITASSNVKDEVDHSFTTSATTPPRVPAPRPTSADFSPLSNTTGPTFYTPKSSPEPLPNRKASPEANSEAIPHLSPLHNRKRKSEESNGVDPDLVAFTNGTRKKKRVNYNF